MLHGKSAIPESPQKGSSILSSQLKFLRNPVIPMATCIFDIPCHDVYTFNPESRPDFALKS